MDRKSPAIVFDLGKVLLDFDYSIAAAKVAGRCQREAPDIMAFFARNSLLVDFETGLLSNQEFYDRVCQATGYCGDMPEFADSFGDIFKPIQPMIDLNEELRMAGFPTYIFSNTNGLAVDHIRSRYPFFRNFDDYILSYEHGSMKPDPRLYEVVEKKTGRTGAAIVYVDDRPENISTGAHRGWRVVLQETPDQSRTAIRQMGLLNGHS
jgi:HAD superfamily hydrolase (TIGR01509 family)